jgi:hypothetical protein
MVRQQLDVLWKGSYVDARNSYELNHAKIYTLSISGHDPGLSTSSDRIGVIRHWRVWRVWGARTFSLRNIVLWSNYNDNLFVSHNSI